MNTPHWTNESTENFTTAIAMDFISELEQAMEQQCVSRFMLANRLGVTQERVAHAINDPSTLTLQFAVDLARALGYKVALVTYDDNDKPNNNGPVFSGVFSACWDAMGKPTDNESLKAAIVQTKTGGET